MSEPVGNSPRTGGEIVPGNSHKEQKAKATPEPETEREPVAKIVEGKVTVRKQPWWKRFGHSLIAEDAQSLGDFITTDILLPAIRNMIRDVVVGGVDRTLYGQSRARRVGVVGERPGLRTRYDQISSDERAPRRMMSREARARHDFQEIVLDDRPEAIAVLEDLIARVVRYGAASVSDLYDLVGVTGSYADRRWGWTDLATADVRQVRGGFLIDLPQPEPLR